MRYLLSWVQEEARSRRPEGERWLLTLRGSGRQGELESGAGAGSGLHPDPSAVLLHDPAADGEPNAGSWVPLAHVQALEHLKDALHMARLDADSVVRHGHLALVAARIGPDAHHGRLLAAELDGVAEQVGEELGQEELVTADHRQSAALQS